METNYETIVGLEIHVQILTHSKAFSKDGNSFANHANANAGVITLAHPGTLPKMNIDHLHKAVLLGMAFGSNISKKHFFDRKHYFYPDLPKGYQITQDKMPYCTGGTIRFISEGIEKSIRIHHIHMEEDAGKSIHDQHASTLVDFNRAGVPLLEIVTEPDFRSGQEVSDFLAELRKTVQYLGISDGNMEEGAFRCDCNVSVRKKGVQTLGERNEIKNVNSRRFAKNAIDYEAKRQIAIIENGGIIQKTTLLYDPVLNETRPMRKKESENDYRYFPEPDLPPVLIDEIFLKEIEQKLVALPIDRYYKLVNDYKLSSSDAIFLTEEKAWTELYFLLASHSDQYKLIAELLVQKILPYLNLIKKEISIFKDLLLLLRFVELLQNGKIAKSAAYQHVFPVWIDDISQNPEDIAQNLELFQSDNQDFLDVIIAQVIIANQDKVTAYKKGKTGLLGFFMGQVMQISGGKADPNTLKSKMEAALGK